MAVQSVRNRRKLKEHAEKLEMNIIVSVRAGDLTGIRSSSEAQCAFAASSSSR